MTEDGHLSIAPGTHVFVEDGPCDPSYLSALLPDGIELHTFFVVAPPAFLTSVADGRSELVSNFPGRGLRTLSPDRFRYPRRSFSEVVSALGDDVDAITTALVRVSPPDGDGRCSFGLQASYLPELLAHGRRILAEVDGSLPIVAGAPTVLWERLEVMGRSVHPPTELVVRPPTDADRAIARHVLSLVPGRPTVQLGIGAVADAVCEALAGRRDVRIRSGMVSDAVMGILEALDDRDGPEHPPIEAALLAGSSELYRWAATSPMVRLVPSNLIHDPIDLATIPRLVAVNSGLEVDLTGSVNSEWVNGAPIAGRGGQPDFCLGAHGSTGGLSVIALPARRPDGQATIVPELVPQMVSTSGDVVDAVVTEWGVADLRGLDDHDRARRIVTVAHPDDRAALLRALGARG